MKTRVLLCSPLYPDGYQSQAWDNPVTDFGDLQFTGHQGLFTLHGHMHEQFAHVIAQNLASPVVYLEYPRREQFLAEVDKGYEIVGIHLFYNQVETVFEMCRIIRSRSPRSKIVLGGYGALGIAEKVPPDELRPLADHLCIGEGVTFMRKLLGEPNDAPIRVTHLPGGGVTLPWNRPYVGDELGAVVASLGCPYGCDFCGTTKMFNRKRQVLIPPKALADEVLRIYEEKPYTNEVAVYEEDSFMDSEYLEELGEHLRKSERGLDLGLFVLGGVKSIQQWGENAYDRIARCGVGTVFLGVESKFAPEHGYKKRTGDTKQVFKELHRRGITTIGAWICGWDFHTRANIQEDLAFFLSLKPTMHQLTTLCPFPGTDLFRKLEKEGRVPEELSWRDLSFFGAGGGVEYKNFESHELFEIIHDGYRRSYELWGPSIARMLEVHLNGYEWCMASGDADLAKRANYHRRMVMQSSIFLPVFLEFAPNGMVRRQLRELASRYRRVIGEPTSSQKLVGALALERARHEQRMRQRAGRARYTEIPAPRAVRYEFAGLHNVPLGARPWTAHYMDRDPQHERFKRRQNVLGRGLAAANEAARLYDHLRRRSVAERKAVDDAARLVESFAAPVQ